MALLAPLTLVEESQVDADGCASGAIYVARSLSEHPFDHENREVPHKIGLTTGEPVKRISGVKETASFKDLKWVSQRQIWENLAVRSVSSVPPVSPRRRQGPSNLVCSNPTASSALISKGKWGLLVDSICALSSACPHCTC